MAGCHFGSNVILIGQKKMLHFPSSVPTLGAILKFIQMRAEDDIRKFSLITLVVEST